MLFFFTYFAETKYVFLFRSVPNYLNFAQQNMAFNLSEKSNSLETFQIKIAFLCSFLG